MMKQMWQIQKRRGKMELLPKEFQVKRMNMLVLHFFLEKECIPGLKT